MLDNVDIVIPTRNRWADLSITVEKLIQFGFGIDQFTIIDDTSEEASSEQFEKQFEGVKIVRHEKAQGQLKSRNELFNITSRDYVLSLDDDSNVMSAEDVLEAIKLLTSRADYGAFAFRAYEQIDLPPPKDVLKSSSRLVRTFIACGAIFKRQAIDSIGNYTRPELGYYCEELDCSIRLYMKGFKVVTQENLVVHHRVNRTFGAMQKRSDTSKGIYGSTWRSKMGFSDNLIVTAIYYPFLYNLLFIAIYILKRLFLFSIPNRDFLGFIGGLIRFMLFIPYAVVNRARMKYELFHSWIKLPTS